MLVALGANPFVGIEAIFDGAFGSGDRIAVTAVPLIEDNKILLKELPKVSP